MTAKTIEKDWGSETIFADNELYRGKILHIKKGMSIHLQHHEKKDETMYVLSGQGWFAGQLHPSYGNFFQLNPGEVYRIKPGTIHKVWAITDLDIIEVSNAVPDSDVIHHEP